MRHKCLPLRKKAKVGDASAIKTKVRFYFVLLSACATFALFLSSRKLGATGLCRI
jgi:hypothetical protein